MYTKSNPSTILVVADGPSKTARLIPVLAAEGYQIEVVQSVALPLPSLQTNPDLGIIWFPYNSPAALPELENIIRDIQALDRADPLPVLLIIDQDGERWVEPSFRLGITDILTRPIHPLVLRQRVRLLLKARQTEKAIVQLKHQVEIQERQRLINAFDTALQMVQIEATAEHEGAIDVQKTMRPFSIHSHLRFDPEQHCLISDLRGSANCRKIELTSDQCAILLYMVCHPYRALSNSEIARGALGYQLVDEIQARSIVRPHILRLRRKLETDSNPTSLLRTIRGAGYLFSPD